MTFSDVETAVNARFETACASQGAKLLRDNDPEPRTALAPWVRVRISSTSQELLAMGGANARKWRTQGQAIAEVHVPAKKGTAGEPAPMRELFAAIQTQFRGVSTASPDVRYMPPSQSELVTVGDSWVRRTVTVRFTFDEVG